MTVVTSTATNPFYSNTGGTVTTNSESNSLDQTDFLTLLTTQLQNQDPLSPMDNAEFLSQMAQFSTVEGIDRVNTSITGLADLMGANRVSTAASMLGHSVLVPGSLARVDDNGEIHGMAELDQAVAGMTVTYTDPTTGQVLHTQEFGSQTSGMTEIDWTDVPDSIKAAGGQVMVSVTATSENGMISVPTSVFARVESAIGGPSSDSITLMVEDYGALDTLEVTAFR